MKILITGSQGQLGKACTKEFSDNELFLGTHQNCDITDKQKLEQVIKDVQPTMIINCAAYTNVKAAEQDPLQCYKVNVEGVYNLAILARDYDLTLVHISTDFVYDGSKLEPYNESDYSNALNVYGRSKQLADTIVTDLVPKYYIFRPSWVFGEGKNFVKTVLALAEKQDELKLPGDQYGSPTYTKDLAQWIKEVIATNQYGVYLTSNEGYTTWAEYAQTILEFKGLKNKKTLPITSDQLPVLFNDHTRRPSNTRFNKQKVIQIVKSIRPWQDALEEYLEKETYE